MKHETHTTWHAFVYAAKHHRTAARSAMRDRDRVEVRNLRLDAIVGLNPDERVTPQPVILTFTLWTDFDASAEADRLIGTPEPQLTFWYILATSSYRKRH